MPKTRLVPIAAQSALRSALADESIEFPSEIAADLEPAFRVSLRRIRLHSGPESRRAARLLDARAFATGPHIVLSQPRDRFNTALLAHEITHVIQSAGLQPALRQELEIEPFASPPEK